MRSKVIAILITSVIGGLLSAEVIASCGASYCPLNTQWETQGVSNTPGMRFDLRYEAINQDQPAHASDDVEVGEIARHHDEVETENQNWVTNFDYSAPREGQSQEQWGINVNLPWVERDHLHIHNHHGAQLNESWDFKELGDLRVLGRYRGSAWPLGIQVGLKLSTGKFDVDNEEGEIAERTLQPGSGTTDLLLGAYTQGIFISPNTSWFVQGQWQKPLNSRNQFKPGYQFTLDTGLRYRANSAVNLLLQLNTLRKGRDSGDEAEPDDSGSRYLLLSPGISVKLTDSLQAYAFWQRPLYQYVNGVQLTADSAWSVGVSAHF
jgi:hypothetical protein